MKSSNDVSPDIIKFFGGCMAHDLEYRCVEARLEIYRCMEVRALADDCQFSSICR